MFLLSILFFALVNLAPGGPLAGYSGGEARQLTPQQAALIKRQLGVDQPLPAQYVIWLVGNDWMKVNTPGGGRAAEYGTRGGILRGDFGTSFRSHRPVLTEISARLGNTIYLMVVTLLVSLLIAILAGILSAVRQYSFFDIFVTSVSFAGQAIPEFWLGLVLIIIFYGWLRNPLSGDALLPSGGILTIGASFSIGTPCGT